MLIDDKFLNELEDMANVNPRHRQHYDLRTSLYDSSQRILNYLMPDTKVPIHRHNNTTETVIILRGKMDEVLYDENGIETERYTLCPENGVYAIQVPKGMYHTAIAHTPCVIFEAKDKAYDPQTTEDIFQQQSIGYKV